MVIKDRACPAHAVAGCIRLLNHVSEKRALPVGNFYHVVGTRTTGPESSPGMFGGRLHAANFILFCNELLKSNETSVTEVRTLCLVLSRLRYSIDDDVSSVF